MKKFSLIILCLILACSSFAVHADEETVLRVYNWQDYINEGEDDDGAKVDESVLEMWEADYFKRTGKKVRVQYDTFETNETMLNTLKTGKTSYDLVCPSDYIIQKMIRATEDGSEPEISLEKYDVSKMTNYRRYVSPFISNLFETHGWTDYAVGYMWGTVGFLYNPENVKAEDAATWDLLWNGDYKNRVTCKDVSRDAYVVGAFHVFRNELYTYKEFYENGKITADELTAKVHSIANNTEDDTITKVGTALSEMKKNIYGFEVDGGKTDIVSGKIHANLAWSGDAVYAMDLAEEEDGKLLEFAVPEEGSTIWFDGWVMPKGAQVELAQDFVDFLCKPEIAAYNMDYIGYTSAIAGDEIYDMVCENYAEDDGKYDYDLTYFFDGTVSDDRYNADGKITVKTGSLRRQLATQYPDGETTARCGIMEDFGDRNEKVLEMWSSVKSNQITPLAYVMMAFIMFLFVAAVVVSIRRKARRRRMHRRIARKM